MQLRYLLSPPLPPLSVVVDVVRYLLSLPNGSGGFSLRWREGGVWGTCEGKGGGVEASPLLLTYLCLG